MSTRGRKRIVTPEKLRDAAARGISQGALARELGVHKAAVSAAVKKFGIRVGLEYKAFPFNDQGATNKYWCRWSDEETATLRRLWLAGVSTVEIAKVLPGRNDHMVIGKAHSLKLPRHPALSWPRVA